MISDFVKGKRKFDYPLSIQKGIYVHRLIDEFTDNHPVTARAKAFFRPEYRLYSGPFVDIVYDHFLACDEQQFQGYEGLENFTKMSYQLLEKNKNFFPFPFHNIFPYMKAQNWLYSYRLKEGMRRSFGGLVHRAAYLYESESAFKIFNENYVELEDCYATFFPELKEYTIKHLTPLLAE